MSKEFVTPERIRRFNRLKRAIDVVAVVSTAPLTLPTGLLITGISYFSTGKPVLYKQERLGFKEQPFQIFKFRTMTNALDSEGNLLPDAERVTKFGSLLRKTSLDELPQLLNILRGEMSLIGPRPLLVSYKDAYFDDERIRHQVRPGVTGLAQTEGRNSVLWPERLKLDVDYVKASSLAVDVRIFVKTLEKVLRRKDVVVIASETGEKLNVMRSYPREGGVSFRRLERVDLPTRVAWFKNDVVRKHMQLPANPNLEDTDTWWKTSHLDPKRRDFTFYEIESNRIVAMAGIREKSDLPHPEVYIIVNPETQGVGIGSKVLRLLHRWVLDTGTYGGLSLTVSTGNEPAIRLYERNGYVVDNDLSNENRLHMNWHGNGAKDLEV